MLGQGSGGGGEGVKISGGRRKKGGRETTMEDLHRAEFGEDHSFRRRSAARRGAGDTTSSDEEGEEEEDAARDQKKKVQHEGKTPEAEDQDGAGQKKGRFSLFKRSKKSPEEEEAEEAKKARKAKAKRKEAKEKAKAKAKASGKSRVLDPRRMRSWLTRPCRQGDKPLLCYVSRDRSGSKKLYPVYRVFMDDGRNEFIMMGRKRAGKATSNFLVTMDHDVIDRSSDLILAKLRANVTGSEYTIYDHGMSPGPNVSTECVRRELGMIYFEYDKMGPGKIQFAVPGGKAVFRPMNEDEKIHTAYKSGDTSKLVTGTNKRPKWDEHAGGHVLNFHGRVTMSSVKNFQLFSDATGEDTVLQFGRVGKEKFTMDVTYPLSPVQAFAIVLASMDKKMADSSLADGVKGIRKSWFGFGKKKAAGGKEGEEGEEAGAEGEDEAGEEGVSSKKGESDEEDAPKRPWDQEEEQD